jgi:hypothetical protein
MYVHIFCLLQILDISWDYRKEPFVHARGVVATDMQLNDPPLASHKKKSHLTYSIPTD